MSLTTSPSLLIRIRNPRDQESWEQFLQIYSGIVRDYCFQRRLQPADTEDVVQDVMSSVCKAIRSFEYDPRKGRFRAWLGTIVANRIKNLLNKRSRDRAKSGIETNIENHIVETGQGAYVDPDSEWVAIFSERIFRLACRSVRPMVSEIAWECFQATWIREENASEFALANAMTVNAVYVHKYKVLKKLEAEIRRLAEDLPFHED